MPNEEAEKMIRVFPTDGEYLARKAKDRRTIIAQIVHEIIQRDLANEVHE